MVQPGLNHEPLSIMPYSHRKLDETAVDFRGDVNAT